MNQLQIGKHQPFYGPPIPLLISSSGIAEDCCDRLHAADKYILVLLSLMVTSLPPPPPAASGLLAPASVNENVKY